MGGVSLNGNYYRDTLSLILVSVAALYVICFLSRQLEGHAVGKFLALCGKDSFYIMGLHFVGFKLGTIGLNWCGADLPLAALTAPAGDSLGLLLIYLGFGVLFPVAFMWGFRQIKAVVWKK